MRALPKGDAAGLFTACAMGYPRRPSLNPSRLRCVPIVSIVFPEFIFVAAFSLGPFRSVDPVECTAAGIATN